MFRLFVFSWLLINPVLGAQHTYSIANVPGSVSFTIRNFGLGVEGIFGNVRGEIYFDPQQIASASFRVSVGVKTIDTGIALRDRHLLKADYFNAEERAEIRFVSESVKPGDERNVWLLRGRLTIKGVAKSVAIPFRTETLANNDLIFSGKFKIDRKDFDVGGKSISLDDEVTVTLKVLANHQPL
jgi:polyisoprenoid-binding protein YceI